MFPPAHPTGTPPVCIPPPRIVDGMYRPPAFAGDCGVNCLPVHFAPPPDADPAATQAWLQHVANSTGGAALLRGMLAGHAQALQGNRAFDEGRANATRAGAAFGIHAPPVFDGRHVSGAFVETSVRDDLGIDNFSVMGTTFFRGITPHGGHNVSFSSATGSAVVAAGDSLAFETHNVPSGLLAYRSAGDATHAIEFEGAVDGEIVEFDVGAEFESALGMHLVRHGDWTGVVVGDASVHGSTIEAQVAAEAPVFFMAIPPGTIEETTRLGIAEAVAERRVFAELSLLERNGTIAEDVTFYDDANTFSVEVADVTDEQVTLNVSGEGEGQAFVFTVDRETLTTPLSELAVEIDGELLPECTSATDKELAFLEPTPETCYQIEVTEELIRVAVDVEHFSTHVVVIGTVTPEVVAAIGGEDDDGAEDAAEDAPADATDEGAPAANEEEREDEPGGKGAPGVGPVSVVVAVAIAALVVGGRRKR